jgi:hypothetical protein
VIVYQTSGVTLRRFPTTNNEDTPPLDAFEDLHSLLRPRQSATGRAAMTFTSFERRRRRVSSWQRRPIPAVNLAPDELGRFLGLERAIVARSCELDDRFDTFVEFFTLEHRLYGSYVRPGLLAARWLASQGGHGHRRVAKEFVTTNRPGERVPLGRFLRWAGDTGRALDYVDVAIAEFLELASVHRIDVWRRRATRHPAWSLPPISAPPALPRPIGLDAGRRAA